MVSRPRGSQSSPRLLRSWPPFYGINFAIAAGTEFEDTFNSLAEEGNTVRQAYA